ncbi:hypothetical protein CAPTEDRAFT_196281 [Capitella teleta]|uniref:Uncharacterized protein n=1 Tax=Capitella teleta TaxID=283909 RepID=R7T4D5_CAPTE|nr:hypothetical protein CAPTEDRAFT_196281 [Capitella teleta]|eukprot:ELT87857.1 hypothetical protein CAPTEDRAFT_196281 [Capitella teleta]
MPAISPDELQRLIGKAVTAAIERVTCFFNEKLAKVNRRLEEQDLELNITKERLKKIEVAVNHQEQYSRRTHFRIKGLECLKSDSVKDPRYYPDNMKSSANLPYMYRSPKMCGIVRLDLTGTFAWLSDFSVELSIHSDVWCPEIGGLIPKLRTRKLFI